MKINTDISRQNKSYANEAEFTKRPNALEVVSETKPMISVLKDPNSVSSYANTIYRVPQTF